MQQRCYNQKHRSYKHYGKLGVVVAERWRDSFEAFLEDVGTRPSPMHSLDRFPNKDGNYEPGNVRWATDIEQANNKSNNVLLTFAGKTQTLSQWAHEYGIRPVCFHSRIRRGWTPEEALELLPRA
jgi:hypothetical protein